MKTSLFSAELIDTTESLRLCSRKLSSFPHINDVEFDGACSALLESFELYGRRQSEWIGVDVVSHNETRYLKITKALSLHLNAPEASSESEGDELNEEDDEVAESSASCQTVIHYDIVLSPTYRVPVLYFAVSDTQYRCPPTMETLYSLVIPPHFKPQTESVGVIGGVTVTDHPVTNEPVFFIHPCHTTEVMETCVNAQDISAYDYLVMWIGALGSCVGLNVPLTFARRT